MCIDAAPRDGLGGQTAPGELLRHHRRQKFCRLRAGRPERACGAVPSCHCDSGGRCVAERCRRPQGSILGVHDDLSCTRTCVWSSWSCMPTMQPCLSESRRDGKKGTGSKGVGWAQRGVASAKGLQISAILTPVLRAVPNMNQGGAPKGKRASTELRDRERRELAPLLQDARQAQERASKRRFFECLAGARAHGSTALSEHMPTHTEMPQLTPPAVDAVDAPSPSVNVQSLRSLPAGRNDREEDTLYSYQHSGRNIIVRWQKRGHFIACACDLSPPNACKGGLRLDRCPSIRSSSSLGAPARHRPKDRHNHAATTMAGSFSGKMSAPRDSLYAGEMQRIQNLYEIGPSVSPSHEAQVIVTDNGRWDQKLMRFEAWTFESHEMAFPLRVDAAWRKTFRGRSKHGAAVNKQSVTIRFKTVSQTSTS